MHSKCSWWLSHLFSHLGALSLNPMETSLIGIFGSGRSHSLRLLFHPRWDASVLPCFLCHHCSSNSKLILTSPSQALVAHPPLTAGRFIVWSLAFTAAHAEEHQEWYWLTEHWSHPCLHTAYFVAGIVLCYCSLGIFINSQWASLNKHCFLFNNSGTVRIAIPWKTILWSTGVHFPLAVGTSFQSP